MTPALALFLALCPGGAEVTRAELEAAGATYVHDVLRLARVLDTVSPHGFDALPVSPDLPFGARVRVLVDGAPVATGAGPEPHGLEALPVALGEIARVVVCPGDGLAAGALGGPWIDVQTAPPARRAYGSAVYGNETGDPGPLVYLDPALPNVDRWGPDYEGALAAGPAHAAVRRRMFHASDRAYFDRIFGASGGTYYPIRTGTVGAVALAAGGVRGRLGVRSFSDLPFVPSVGREVPTLHTSAQATATGERRVGAVRLHAHGHAARLALERPEWGRLPFDLGWSETRLDAALGAEGVRLAGGARVEHVSADGPGLDAAATVGRAWARAGRSGAGRTGATLTLAGAASGSGLGGGAVADWTRQRGPLALDLRASVRRTLAEETPDLAFWTARGYSALGPGPERHGPTDVARLWASVSRPVGAVGVRASAEATAAAGPVFLGTVGAEAEGVAGRATLGAEWDRPAATLRADVRVQGALGGDGPFRRAWRRLPLAVAAASATVRPDARLALWARVEARSGTEWDAADVPGALLLDLGLSKRAWGDRLRLSLAGRNVLGAPERTHPLGATLDPRLIVRAEVRI